MGETVICARLAVALLNVLDSGVDGLQRLAEIAPLSRILA